MTGNSATDVSASKPPTCAGSPSTARTPSTNGFALCALHHKLLDRGALGLTSDHRIKISHHFTTRTPTGRLLYDLADRQLQPRPGPPLPAPPHLARHDRKVFKA
jgi:putative restriction endonuclease